jgi:arylsulfatase A-like enzyme
MITPQNRIPALRLTATVAACSAFGIAGCLSKPPTTPSSAPPQPVHPPVARVDAIPPQSPNIVLIVIDDLGYGDIGPFGSTKNRTPHLDRMAREGMKLTSFYTAPVCTPSRAQFMTGCYAKRVGLPKVIGPAAAIGLNPKENTVAALLKQQGYATMCVGKWHLGDDPKFLPTSHGFDAYFGLPYSNDMNGGPASDGKKGKKGRPPLPLVHNDRAIDVVTQEKQHFLVERYTNAALKFIRESAGSGKPFFLYFPHTAVHVPIHPGPKFAGKSANGRYGDWVEEVDWSTGRVMDTLRELGVADSTLVIFSSDNGPWATRGADAGVATPLRGAKGGTFEGGVRVPTIAWWPGSVPAGASIDTITGSIDMLPTLVALAGGTVPADNKIDGADISQILLGKTTESARKVNYYFMGDELQAVRLGPWKLAITAQEERTRGVPKFAKDSYDLPRLYNLDTDIGERKNGAARHPEIVRQLQALVAGMGKDLGLKEPGPGARAPGRVANPTGLWVSGRKLPREIIEMYYD